MKVKRFWLQIGNHLAIEFEDGYAAVFEPLYDVVSMDSEDIYRFYLYDNTRFEPLIFLWRGMWPESMQPMRNMYIGMQNEAYSIEEIALYWQAAIDHITNEWLTYQRDEDWYPYILVTKSQAHVNKLRSGGV